MRLVEFLIRLLSAHAETLQLLSAALGPEEFLALLDHDEPPESTLIPDPAFFSEEITKPGVSSPYQEIEGAVRELDLPATLEFYLWAYPTYRALIESAITLESCANTHDPEKLTLLTDACIQDARKWLSAFPIPAALHATLAKLTASPWLKFRSAVLTEGGQKRLRVV